MPVILPTGLKRMREAEYQHLTYEVMEIVFNVHNQMGNLFDELIYQKAIASLVPGAELEVPVTVFYDAFRKAYYGDLLVLKGAVFELKTVEVLSDQHRAQLLHYLLLMELPHGKLVNMRPGKVVHEFVNAPLTRADRINFAVDESGFTETGQDRNLPELAVGILRDWGTCLDVQLYEEALAHFFGGKDVITRPVAISREGSVLGRQKVPMLGEAAALRVTTLNDKRQWEHYRSQLAAFVEYTALNAIQWVNIGRKRVSFVTIQK